MNLIVYGSEQPIYFMKGKRKPMKNGKVILQHENGKPFEAENGLERIEDYYYWIPTKKETECKILSVHAFADPAPAEHYLTGSLPEIRYEGG